MNIENLSLEIKKDVFSLVIKGIRRENNYNDYIFSYGNGKPGYTFTAPLILEGYSKTIKFFRETSLKGNKSVLKMQKIIDQYDLINVREVVILIDTERWIRICQEEGITGDWVEEVEKVHGKKAADRYRSILHKKHIRLDWFFPDYHVNLEHDGSNCHSPIEDRIRDRYIREAYPSITIKRIIDYKDSKGLELKTFLSSMTSKKTAPLVFRYEEYVWKCFLEKYANALCWIDFWHNKRGVPYGEIYNIIKGKYPKEDANIRMLLEKLKTLNSL